ncbi:MAG: protein kinase [Chloroflexia bacterium]
MNADSEETVRVAFANEVRLSANLGNHSNLVIVRDTTDKDASHRPTDMVMEHRGTSLDDALRKVLPDALTIATDLARAANHLHTDVEVLHNAVYPENIVVDGSSHATLLDLGAACTIADAGAFDVSAIKTAAHPYVAPEVLDGLPPSAASDVYSIGAVLYAMLTGSPPSSDAGALAVTVLSGLPVNVADLVRSALERDPAVRAASIPSASDLHQKLDALRTQQASVGGGPLDRTQLIVPGAKDGEVQSEAARKRDRAKQDADRKYYPVAQHIALLSVSTELDFGTITPGGAAPTKTIKIESALAGGRATCSADWLEASPASFGKGVHDITISVLPERLPQGGPKTAETSFDLPGMRGQIVAKCRARHPNGVDLVCIVDQIADRTALDRRINFVSDFIEAASTKLAPLGVLRVGVFGYSDYDHRTRKLLTPAVDLWLRTPAEATRAVAQLRPVEGSDFEAALEDAIYELSYLEWQEAAAHVAVFVGNRPPHPKTPESNCIQMVNPDKRRRDWQLTLAELRADLELLTVVVADAEYWPSPVRVEPAGPANPPQVDSLKYANDSWGEIAGGNPVQIASTTAEQIAALLSGRLTPTTA